jgi:uncharacterized protein YkwD
VLRAIIAVIAVGGAVALWSVYGRAPAQRDDLTGGHEPGPKRPQAGSSDDELGPVQVGEVEVELSQQPVAHYGAEVGDGGYREVVEAVAPDAFDANLTRAAGEYAVQAVRLGAEPSDRVMSFLLHSAGAPEYSVARYVVTTNDESEAALRGAVARAVEQAPPGPGRLVVGVGESFDSEAERPRRIAILTARRELDASNTARLVDSEARWRVHAELLVDADELVATALLPSGELVDCKLGKRGDRLEVEVPVGSRAGTVWLSIDARKTPRGPRKLAQLSAEIGSELPERRTIVVPPEEEWTGTAAAEAYVLELINRDRRSLDLPPLELDPQLSAVARKHSLDMRDHDFFGHVSPSTGTVADRLAAVEYQAASFAENLARNDRVAEAHASLMWSVGHRKNLVSPRFDRVGIGVVGHESNGRTDWYVTEVFALAPRYKNPNKVRAALAERIDRARERGGLSELRQDRDLTTAIDAFLASEGSSGRDRDALVAALGRDLRSRLRGDAQIVLFSTNDPDGVELPGQVLDDSAERLAIGVVPEASAGFLVAILLVVD